MLAAAPDLTALPGAAEGLPQAARVGRLVAAARGGSNAALVGVLAECARRAPDAHRRRAYARAADALQRYPVAVASGEVAALIPGIGPSIAETVQEVLTSGRSTKLEQLRGKA